MAWNFETTAAFFVREWNRRSLHGYGQSQDLQHEGTLKYATEVPWIFHDTLNYVSRISDNFNCTSKIIHCASFHNIRRFPGRQWSRHRITGEPEMTIAVHILHLCIVKPYHPQQQRPQCNTVRWQLRHIHWKMAERDLVCVAYGSFATVLWLPFKRAHWRASDLRNSCIRH